MLKLAAVFEDAAGKTHHWSYNEPDPNKSPEEIRALLEAMTQLNLFEKNGIKQFQKVVSAKFVQTIETPLFDLSKSLPEVSLAETNNVFTSQPNSNEVPKNQTELVEAETVNTNESQGTTGEAMLHPSTEPTKALNNDYSSIQKPVNPRKAQVDRVRASHEARKKKKGKKKRS